MSQFHPDLIKVAVAVNWYAEPEKLLANTELFLNQVMARGDLKEVCIAQEHYSTEQFQSAYENAPPGLYGPKSWAFWGLKLFGEPDYKPNPVRYPGCVVPGGPWPLKSM